MEYTIGSKVFDGWEITRTLGEGSYGKVFAIEKSDYGFTTRAALKLIRIPKSPAEIRDILSDGMDEKSVTTYFEEIVERFIQEIAVMIQLKGHPNVVSCENYRVEPHAGTIGWDILIKMELLQTLQDYQLEHPMGEAEVRRLAEHICRALMFIQKQGLIHRDIKPSNIFVDNLGQFKLGDFGVARTAEKTLGGMSKQGTENYMAPEVYHGKPYGVSVDIYSLGLVLYRMMNGNRLPFYPPAPQRIGLADRENALISRMMGQPLLPPKDASPQFAQIILKACAHDPKDRYQTAAQMLEALMEKPEVRDYSTVRPPVQQPQSGSSSGGSLNQATSSPQEDDGDATVNIFGSRRKAETPPEDDGDATVNVFGSRHKAETPPPEDDGDATVNIFGSRRKVETPPPEDDGDATVNVFGSRRKAETPPEDDGDATVNIFGSRRKVETPPEDDADATVNIFGSRRKAETPPQKNDGGSTDHPSDNSKKSAPPHTDTEKSRRDAMLDFWKKNLTSLWAPQPDKRWKAYFAPDIPLQVCSNAIFNIAESEVRKDEILAVLDCTPDTRVPCGRGILITAEKMYINMLIENANPQKYPKAVLEFSRLRKVWSGVEKGILWVKYPCIYWETTDGRKHCFGVNMHPFIDYTTAAKLLSSPQWQQCIGNTNLP